MPTRTNYIQHLNGFFAQVRKDDRLHANHISLYLALFQVWNQYRFQNPFPILREEVIRLCRIGSLNTYTRCLKDLAQLGYINYQPAPQRGMASLIGIYQPVNNGLTKIGQLSLFDENVTNQANRFLHFQDLVYGSTFSKNSYPKNETAPSRNSDTDPVANLRSFNNKHINNKKRERGNPLPPIKKTKNNEVKKKSGQPAGASPAAAQHPEQFRVQQFFQEANYPDQEASKFFYHYQANGWRQSNGLPISDWEAAAHKWMLNAHPQKNEQHGTRNTRNTGTTTQPGRLLTNQDKCYEDPL